jgi:thioesterase domain-containing protein
LPPGVLELQRNGTRNNIFWVHYLNINLAKVLGADQPFLFVLLTAEDFAALGEAPTLQSLAACLLRKIRAMQSEGPYIIGGFCAGGILAYEIASQLRAAGQEVSLLVLLDAPNPAHLELSESLTPKWSYLPYAVQRAARLGLRISLAYLREHLQKHLTRTSRAVRSEVRVAREMINAAVLAYRPQRYEGKVLLLLASERPPHLNLLPGWLAVVSGNLHTQYVDAHRRNLLDPENAQTVADAIVSHLKPGSANELHEPLLVEIAKPA